MMISIIVPVLNEAVEIEFALQALAPFRRRGAEVIVVDGGSSDGTADRTRPLADQVLTAPRGRATQMNAGAAAARGDVLLFLHVDTHLPDSADQLIAGGMARSGRCWGRFDVAFDNRGWLRIIAFTMNWRSRLTGICTGDQAMFVTSTAFQDVGGFPDNPLMEDVALSARLKHIVRPECLRARVTTSARRWHKHGIFRTILLMWRLRLAYFFGAEPGRLAEQYGYVPRQS
jgi:rSAM/selenodomain-associated transferase 2